MNSNYESAPSSLELLELIDRLSTRIDILVDICKSQEEHLLILTGRLDSLVVTFEVHRDDHARVWRR